MNLLKKRRKERVKFFLSLKYRLFLCLLLGLLGGSESALCETLDFKIQDLKGTWHVLWQSGQISELEIEPVASLQSGIFSFSALLKMSETLCQGNGQLIPRAQARIVDGLEGIALSLQAYISFHVTCASFQVDFQLLGLPQGPIFMVGRALFIGPEGLQTVESVALRR